MVQDLPSRTLSLFWDKDAVTKKEDCYFELVSEPVKAGYCAETVTVEVGSKLVCHTARTDREGIIPSSYPRQPCRSLKRPAVGRLAQSGHKAFLRLDIHLKNSSTCKSVASSASSLTLTLRSESADQQPDTPPSHESPSTSIHTPNTSHKPESKPFLNLPSFQKDWAEADSGEFSASCCKWTICTGQEQNSVWWHLCIFLWKLWHKAAQNRQEHQEETETWQSTEESEATER